MSIKTNKQFSFFSKDFESSKPSISISTFIKIENGETDIRILSRPIGGFVRWDNKKPIRSRTKPKKVLDNQEPAKPFVAMVAYDRTKNHLGVLDITQTGLIKGLRDITEDTGWGNPANYDIKFSKSGSGMDTRYTVRPVAPKPLSPEIKEMFLANPCHLEALFSGSNPWNVKGLSKDQLAQGLFLEDEGEAVPF